MPTADISTVLEIEDRIATFVVSTDNPIYQDRLVHMGFARSGEHSFTRSFTNSSSVPRIHQNFALHLERMVRQSARLDPVPWEDALSEFLRRAEVTDLNWFLAGSGALAVRGIEVDPGDLDFNVDDADLAGSLFDDLLVEPALELHGWVAERFGRAFHGALFEWISDPNPALDVPEEQEFGLAASRKLETVNWRGDSIRVPPLALQLGAAERRGLHDRAAMIRAALRKAERSR